jgi:hypothetical protein
MVIFLQRSSRVKELLRAEHSSIFPVVALKEWKSDGRLSSERLPRQGTAQGGTLFHLPSSRPERMGIRRLSFFGMPAVSKNRSGRNTIPSPQ